MAIEDQLAAVEEGLNAMATEMRGKIPRSEASAALLALEARATAMQTQIDELLASVRTMSSRIRAMTT